MYCHTLTYILRDQSYYKMKVQLLDFAFYLCLSLAPSRLKHERFQEQYQTSPLKRNKKGTLDFNDVTLVVVDIKSERFVKSTCLQQDLFDMTMVTIMFDTKTSESESFIDRSIEGIINIMMEFHHF